MDDRNCEARAIISSQLKAFFESQRENVATGERELAYFNVLLKCAKLTTNIPMVAGNGFTAKNIASLQKLRAVVRSKTDYALEVACYHHVKFLRLYFEYFAI